MTSFLSQEMLMVRKGFFPLFSLVPLQKGVRKRFGGLAAQSRLLTDAEQA